MEQKTKKRLNLSAKIVAIFYIAMIVLVSFDVPIFSWGFLIHLLPTVIFLGCLIVAWFKPRVGGILFFLAGLGTIIVFNTYRETITFLTISIIPVVVGVLFLLGEGRK